MTEASPPIRVALIGTGPWARNLIKTVQGVDGLDLSMVMNASGRRPEFVPPDVRLVSYRTDNLTTDSIDAVLIATPPRSHAGSAIAALQRGLPVFIEKPLTLDHGEATEILAWHGKSPAPFVVDHIYLFHAGYRALKQALPDQGKIRAIATVGGNKGPVRRDTPTLWDWAPHDVAMCLDILGREPEHVACRDLVSGERGQGQNFDFSLTFSGHCEARIHIGNLFSERRRQVTVYTEDETLRFEDEAVPSLRRYPIAEPFTEPAGLGEDMEFSGNLPLTQAVTEFRDAIRRKDTSAAALEFGLQVVELIERLDRSVQAYADPH